MGRRVLVEGICRPKDEEDRAGRGPSRHLFRGRRPDRAADADQRDPQLGARPGTPGAGEVCSNWPLHDALPARPLTLLHAFLYHSMTWDRVLDALALKFT